jgi:hypothetical protein
MHDNPEGVACMIVGLIVLAAILFFGTRKSTRAPDLNAELCRLQADNCGLRAKIAQHERIEAELQRIAASGMAAQSETIKQLLKR